MKIKLILSLALAFLLNSNGICDDADDRFNFAKGLYIKKEYELAAEEFEGLLAKNPDYRAADEALFWLGQSLFRMDQRDRSEKAFRKLTEKFPASERLPIAYFRLGQIASGNTKSKEAAEFYATVARRWPGDKLAEETLYWSGEELFKAGEFGQASKTYREVLNKFPAGEYTSHSTYSLGWSEFNGGEFDSAAKAFRSFLEKFPKHERAGESRLKLAESLYKLKQYDAAVTEYNRVVEAGGEISQEATLGKAWCLYEQGKFKDAAAAFKDVAGALGKTDRAANCIFNAGKAYMEIQDFNSAASEFAKLATGFGDHKLAPESSYWYGYCLLKQGKLQEAEAVLDKANASGKVVEKKVELLHSLAEAKLGLGKSAEAAGVYGAIIKQFPKHELADKAGYGRMLALEKAGDLVAAEAAGEEFFKLYPNSDVGNLARFALAEYRFRQKKFAAAEKEFKAFVASGDLADLGDHAHYKLGWCAFNQKRPADAIKHFSAVIKEFASSPLAPESAYMIGKACEEIGDKPNAKKSYANCIGNYPNDEYGQRSEVAMVLIDIEGKQFQQALDRTGKLLKGSPKTEMLPYIHLFRGEAFNELGKLDEALASYQQVKGNGSAATDAVYGMAWVHRKKKEHALAAAKFADVAKAKAPKSADAAYWRCRSLEDSEDYEKAAGLYAAFASENKDPARADEAAYRHALCVFRSGKLDAAEKLYVDFLAGRKGSDFADNAIYDLAWVYLDRKNPENAASRFLQMLKDFPDSDLVQDVEFRLGEIYYDQKDFAKAEEFYIKSLARGKVGFGDKINYKLAWSLERLKHYDKAIAHFVAVYRDYSESELADEAHYHAGRLLQAQKKFPEAVSEFSSVKSVTFIERALFRTGECLRMTGKHKEALEAYGKMLEKFPESEFKVQADLGKGHSFREVGAFQDALDSYSNVIRQTDTVDAASAVMGIGYVHYARGDYKESAKSFLKVDILYGYEELKPEALKMLAASFEKAGDTEKSAQYMEELKKRYPDSQSAK